VTATPDPDSAVVRLCVDGMAAESDGRPGDALALFRQAWEASTDDYEACIAAHYVARHQADPDEALRWSRVALERALAVGDDDRIAGFLPSLHLDVGAAHESRGETVRARAHYASASERLAAVPAGPYRKLVESGLRTALHRVAAGP